MARAPRESFLNLILIKLNLNSHMRLLATRWISQLRKIRHGMEHCVLPSTETVDFVVIVAFSLDGSHSIF